MGKRCFSVDFSSKILLAMNQGQPAEARIKVRAVLLGRDHKKQACLERVGVTKKQALLRTLPKAERQEKHPDLFPPSTF